MIIIIEGSLIKAKEAHFVNVSSLDKTKDVPHPFWGFLGVTAKQKYKFNEVSFEYTDQEGTRKRWTASNEGNIEPIEALAKNIIDQLKKQDEDFANYNLENAIRSN